MEHSRLYSYIFYLLVVLYTPSFCQEGLGHHGDNYPHPNRKNSAGRENIPNNANKLTNVNLAKDRACAGQLSKICADSALTSNMGVMKCLQRYQHMSDLDLSADCQHLLWTYKYDMTKGTQFLKIATECQKDLPKFPDCTSGSHTSGYVLSCLFGHKYNISSIPCQRFLTEMEAIVFSDYKFIDKFADYCTEDIKKLKCGRLPDSKNTLFGQGETIDCLAKSVRELSEDCKKEVFHVKELQGTEFQLDRPLYFACREDKEIFCENVEDGHGRVLKCLMKHKFDHRMSAKCQAKLTERQKLISENFKISHKLAQECRAEIRDNSCRKNIGETKIKIVKLTHILLCLEGAKHDGKRISGSCEEEMIEHRKMLMSDYRLSPNLAINCQRDIEKFCKNRIQLGGKTIDCLMMHTKEVMPKCRRELEELVAVADAGEDWRVDPVLRTACQPVVTVACKGISGGEGEVLSCLMDHLNSEHMLEECREKLLEIQYFVARDYKLDSKLYKACRSNAIKFCHAKDHWWNDPKNFDPNRGPLILPCLYRYAYHPMEDKRLSNGCLGEVKRVMRQRAQSVNLHPEIEDVCLNDLAEFCVDQVNHGQELSCLQLKLEELTPNCKEAVTKYTEDEGEHMELNYELSHACADVFNRYCSDLLSKDTDEGDLMQCLIENKNKHDVKANVKCRTSIEHFQLISLKDYRFNAKFKEHCQKDVNQYCPNIQSKNDVIYCLSNIHTADVLKDAKKPRISRECQAQLRIDLLEKNENIKLDPDLDIACLEDEKRFCGNISPGQGKVVECLKNHVKELSPECHLKIFNREKEEMVDNAVDYVLVTSCKRMIKQFCPDEDWGEILECLKDHRDNEDMDVKCRKEVVRRMILQNRDYRLNPSLQKSCVKDIPKFCAKVKGTGPHDDEYEGKVILCLKDQYKKHRLSKTCEIEIKEIIKDAALDYRQDPVLAKSCKNEIENLCSEEKINSLSEGGVEECLKAKFEDGEIHNEECKKQVARILHESRSDIHSDPLLYRACALDVKHYCVNIPPGEGKQLSCLLTILESNHATLMPDCKSMLTKRKEMFEMAAVVAPVETFNEVFAQISNSPSRNYFFSVTMFIIGTIFIVGLLFGRVTKRVTALAKNK